MRFHFLLSTVLTSLAVACGGSVSATDEAHGTAGASGGAASGAGAAGASGATASAAGAAGSGGAGAPDTTSCSGPCPHYACTCAQPTPGLGGSGCDPGEGCNTGEEVCTWLCESYGGFVSAVETPSGGGGGGGGGATGMSTSGAVCVGTGAPCSDCIAASCCNEMAACDAECNAISVCVALQCQGDFATCAAACNVQKNAAFAAYAACITANGCAAKCDAEK